MFCVFEALKKGIPAEKIHEITMIDCWFINKLDNLRKMEEALANCDELTEELYLRAKKYGYLDSTIERFSGKKVEHHRKGVYKMVDTCAAEYKAQTPYFYSTYDEENEASEFIEEHKSDKKKILVFGSGPIRIGQGLSLIHI